jgi:S1-C subfamily serine protease
VPAVLARAIGLAIVALVVAGVVVLSGGRDGGGSAGADVPVQSTATAMGGLEQQFEQVVQNVGQNVVEVRTPVGLGSGVVFDNRGDVVTNAHVVGTAHTFTITLAGGEKHSATLVGTDPKSDLAVVRIAGAQPAPATFAGPAGLQVGAIVLAIGNPLGLRSSVTQGIVSSLGRTVTEGNGVTLSRAIQTSAAINPGNSGGALVDLAGQVIGIPTLAALDPQIGNGQAAGIGFAIPASTVQSVATRLIGGG